MKKKMLYLIILFISIEVQSSISNADLSIKSQAILESKLTGKDQNSATSVQVSSGMLTLKDPRPEIITRKWKYFAGVKAQLFASQGQVLTDYVGTIDLNRNNSTIMPSILLGLKSSGFDFSFTPGLTWAIGLRGDAGLTSQATQSTFPSGYSVNSSRLNSTILEAGPVVFAQLKQNYLKYNPEFSFFPTFGALDYTQTSSNEFARFSKNSPIASLTLEVEIPYSKNHSFLTGYTRRILLSNEDQIEVQKNNFEIGTKILW